MPVSHRFSTTSSRTNLFRRLLRPKSVRAKTVALLTVPVVSLMALWALATVSAVQSAWTLHQVKELNSNLAGPVSNLVGSLQAERAAVVQYLAAPRGNGEQAISAQRSRTTAAATELLDGVTVARADIANLTPDVNQRINGLVADLDRLESGRTPIIARQMDWNSAYNAYTTTIEDAFTVDEVLTKVQDGQSAAAARVVLQLARVSEMIARQDAIATSALTTGRMTPEQHQAFGKAVGGQHVLSDGLLPELPAADRAAYQRLVNNDSYRALSSMQNAVLDAGVGGTISGPAAGTVAGAATSALPAEQWRSAMQSVSQSLNTIRADASAATAAQANASSESVLMRAALTAILGLLAVLLALVVSVQIGRGLVIELVGLRNSALELAQRRLPQAMRRLRAGKKIDIDADVPVVVPGEGEIGQVGEALNAVQRSALQAAAERAELLTGVSGVFVNLARRSQSLVHRQLNMLDAMERRTEDPATLEDLFRLDHLATRMRRHSEGLIIMSGTTPGRAWSRPVSLMNVIRSAIAEVEDYARVEMRRMPELSVLGSAVSDLTHLIAELVENATSFSPPDTTVLVHGEPVGTGFVVEIEDRGLGMRPERMAEANRLIADAHQLELFDSDRLGLFVVSRLATRQNISVSLRRSPYGGITAVVLLPTSILAVSESRTMEPERHDRRLTPFDPFSAADEDPVQPPRMALATREPARTPSNGDRQASPRPEPAPQPATPPPRWPEPVARTEPPAVINGRSASQEASASSEEHSDQSTGGLPRRTRQASLAPGLRVEETRERGQKGEEPETVGAQISPEQARAMMSAFQQGFVSGRSAQNGDFPDS
jgi:signal transduction histidine kinase